MSVCTELFVLQRSNRVSGEHTSPHCAPTRVVPSGQVLERFIATPVWEIRINLGAMLLAGWTTGLCGAHMGPRGNIDRIGLTHGNGRISQS
jgi:hypothetical protein